MSDLWFNLYTLRDGQPVRALDVRAWAEWLANADEERTVTRTLLFHETIITSFIGIDLMFGHGPYPCLYETMVFGGKHHQFVWRYATRLEAESGHAAIVDALLLGEYNAGT